VTLATLTDKERADLLRWVANAVGLNEHVNSEHELKEELNRVLDRAWRYDDLCD
jgi:hypothetical protein